MLVKRIISIVILISVILLIGCSDDKITGPKPNPFEGQWVEEYVFSYLSPLIWEWGGQMMIEKNLRSVVSFEQDEFTIKVFDDNDQLLRDQIGTYDISADTIYFYMEKNLPDTFTRTLHYEFLTPDSLYFSTIAYPMNDSGLMSIEIIGVVWGAQIHGWLYGINQKNWGIFNKEE